MILVSFLNDILLWVFRIGFGFQTGLPDAALTRRHSIVIAVVNCGTLWSVVHHKSNDKSYDARFGYCSGKKNSEFRGTRLRISRDASAPRHALWEPPVCTVYFFIEKTAK